MARKVTVSTKLDPTNEAVAFTNRETDDTVSYSLVELPADIRLLVGLYGLNKVLSDRTSDVSKEGWWKRREAMDTVYEMLRDGQWKAERQAAVRVPDAVVHYLADRKRASLAAIRKAFASMDAEKRKATIDRVRPEAEEWWKEQQEEAEAVDLDDLMDGLEE